MCTYCNYRYLFMLRSRVFVCTRVFEGQSMLKMHRTLLYVLVGSSLENAKPFALWFFLYNPFSAHDTMCLIWARLKMLQCIVRILKSVSH
jgi:hypothetical protein